MPQCIPEDRLRQLIENAKMHEMLSGKSVGVPPSELTAICSELLRARQKLAETKVSSSSG